MVLWERSYLTYFVLPGKFPSDVERRAQVSTFFSLQLIIAGFIHLKNLRFAEDVLFYPKNEVMAFPKIKIKWD